MNFLPDVYVTCEVCRGRRYNAETLAVRYKGHSINDVLNLPSSDALKLLENIPQIQQKLSTMVEVGLGYVQLGQSATTLPEAKRNESNSRGSFRNGRPVERCTFLTNPRQDCILTMCESLLMCCSAWLI